MTPATVSAAVMTLFLKYRLKLASFQAVAKLIHCGTRGQNCGSKGMGLTRVIVSPVVFRDVLSHVEERHEADEGAEDQDGVDRNPAAGEPRARLRRPVPGSVRACLNRHSCTPLSDVRCCRTVSPSTIRKRSIEMADAYPMLLLRKAVKKIETLTASTVPDAAALRST